MEWLPQVDQSTIDALSDGIPATIHAIADRSDCGRSQLRIAIDSADSARINAGAPYTGSLILTLAPE